MPVDMNVPGAGSGIRRAAAASRRERILRIALAALAGLALMGPPAQSRPAAAEPAPPASAEERLRVLEAKVAELARELAEARKSGTVPPERLDELERRIDLLTRELERARIGEAAADAPLESRYGLGPAASKVYSKDRGVAIGGYGELLYTNFDSGADDGSPSGSSDRADAQRIVLYFGYKWTDRVLFNSEIEFEHASTGEGDEEKGEVSVEFANVDFLLHEKANVRAGLVLMPVGFINELHEPTTWFGTRRPMTERVIIPATWREIGAGLFGDCGPLSWRSYLTNGLDASGFEAGDGWREGRQGGSDAVAEDFAFSGRLDWTITPGLLAGLSYFDGRSGQGLEDLDGHSLDARTQLVEAHAQWRWQGLHLRALGAWTRLGDTARLNDALGLAGADGVGERMRGYYAEAAFDLLTLADTSRQSLSPFFRFESYDTQSRVPTVFSRDPANNATGWTAGVAWKPISQVVITLDHQNADNAAGTGVDRTSLGLGFIF